MLRSVHSTQSEMGTLSGFCVREAKGTIHFPERSVWLLAGERSLVEVGDQLGGIMVDSRAVGEIQVTFGR